MRQRKLSKIEKHFFRFAVSLMLLLALMVLALVVVITIIATPFGLFGTGLSILFAFAYSKSEQFRILFAHQTSIRNWLAWLPGLASPSPRTGALAILFYGFAFSTLSWLWLTAYIATPMSAVVYWIFGALGSAVITAWFLVGKGDQRLAKSVLPGHERFRSRHETHSVNQSLKGVNFENHVQELFLRDGYCVRETPVTGDEGIDLWLERDGEVEIVQCKEWAGTIGQSVVRDLYGAMGHTSALRGHVVTSGSFSRPAREWALGKPIALIDGAELIRWMEVQDRRLAEELPSRRGPAASDWAVILGELGRWPAAVAVIVSVLIIPVSCSYGAMVVTPVTADLTASPPSHSPAETPASGSLFLQESD